MMNLVSLSGEFGGDAEAIAEVIAANSGFAEGRAIVLVKVDIERIVENLILLVVKIVVGVGV